MNFTATKTRCRSFEKIENGCDVILAETPPPLKLANGENGLEVFYVGGKERVDSKFKTRTRRRLVTVSQLSVIVNYSVSFYFFSPFFSIGILRISQKDIKVSILINYMNKIMYYSLYFLLSKIYMTHINLTF
jgi:hypothetical protein